MTAAKSLVSSNKDRNTKPRRRISIHGKPKAGKTIGALSLIENIVPLMKRFTMTREQLAKEKWVKANALWVSADTNATEGPRVRRLEIPEIDMSSMFVDARSDMLTILEEVTDAVYNHVEKEKPQLVCIDTASAIDKPIMGYLEENGPRTKAGARDSFAIWRMSVGLHERFHTNMSALPCDVVFLMHSKPRSDSESSEKKARSQNLAGGLADIRFDFAYQDVDNIYCRHTDLILVADKKDGEFALFNEEHAGFMVGSRYGNLVPGKITKTLWETFQDLEK